MSNLKVIKDLLKRKEIEVVDVYNLYLLSKNNNELKNMNITGGAVTFNFYGIDYTLKMALNKDAWKLIFRMLLNTDDYVGQIAYHEIKNNDILTEQDMIDYNNVYRRTKRTITRKEIDNVKEILIKLISI